ncbi:protein FAR1-RELATED SEQUENCE 5-like [Arachis stenosperma]|uniref:protein FAR1-RELATED SEQUENCE 5-like n=1 Tax=Arachis stenosperma TaxID=217475 RepID=UPI0025ABDBB8|nr:protein FAR1-RELATED SEQUENCE 5-like [Arachis stenosperma]
MNHIVWNSPSTESFESDWASFIKHFKLGQNRWLAGMRSTQRSESMHAFYGGYLHYKSGLVQFVHEYDNVLGTKEQKELEDDAADSKGVIPCIGSTGIERQFQQEYTSSMFRSLQVEVRKKTDCVVRSIEQKGDTISIAVDEQKGQCECNNFEFVGILCCNILAVWSYYRVDIEPGCYVLLRWSKNVIRKHTYIKSSHDVARSDESNNLFRHMCSEFYNVAQEFVACDKEAAILIPFPHRAQAMELYMTYRDPQESKPKDGLRDEVDLPSDNDHHGPLNKRIEDSTMWNSSDGGGFMHLLNSFRHI